MVNAAFHDNDPVEGLIAAIDEAAQLFCEYSSAATTAVAIEETPGSLLDQCMALCTQAESLRPDPVRTVHHFACTGGTLISKCLAAMPNTQLLSEVDPLSTVQDGGSSPRFAPTDIAALMRQSTRGTPSDLLMQLFFSNLEVIYSAIVRNGQRLILRDHAHGHYCFGPAIPERPTLRSIVSAKYSVLSAVTVRHPIDSYLSLKALGWLQFTPVTLDEYCRRYLAFLDAYEGAPIIKYEDFVAAPVVVMQKLCGLLELPFNEQFVDVFDVFKLTGDSGRSGNEITPRPRRAVEDSLAAEAAQSPNYQRLRDLLCYAD